MQKCLRSLTGHSTSTKRCQSAPFRCHGDSECDSGRQCVLSADFADFHECRDGPKRCRHHKECKEGAAQECVATRARGFRGMEWTYRCLQLPFTRCQKVIN